MTGMPDPLRRAVAEQAAAWLVAQADGDLSAAQRAEFVDWLRASPLHVQEYLALTGLAHELPAATRNVRITREALVASFARASEVHELRAGAGAPRTRPAGLAIRRVSVAVALVVVVLSFLLIWHVKPAPDVYVTAHGEQRSWHLADGSTVYLNAASELRVHWSRERRDVQLIRGQALFKVAKDPARPFWVRTGDAWVKAVGTEFDVYRRETDTVVSVVEGRVAVWRAPALAVTTTTRLPAKPDLEIDAGTQTRVTRAKADIVAGPAPVRAATAWLQQQVVFRHTPLAEVAAEFNRYNDRALTIQSPELQGLEINGVFSAYDVESFVRFLERLPGVHVDERGDGVVVTGALEPAGAR
jgi:transmembrane sensor